MEEDEELIGGRRRDAGRCVDNMHDSFERIRNHVGLFLHVHDEGRESALQLGCDKVWGGGGERAAMARTAASTNRATKTRTHRE